MSDQFDAVFYVKDAPTITFEDGHVHITYQIGKRANFEVVLAPNTYLRALRAASRVADDFHEREAVVEFRKGAH